MIVDLIITNIKELLTLKGDNKPRIKAAMKDLGIINDAVVVINGGKIQAVGKVADISNKFKPKKIIDAKNKIVMPGFVDPHTHPVFFKTREKEFDMRIQGKSYVEISQTGGGIRASIEGVRKNSEAVLYKLSKKRVKEIMSYGTTTLEAKSGYGLSTESEIKMLKVIKKLGENSPIDIKATFLGAHEYPKKYKDNHSKYIQILKNEMIPEVANKNLAEYCDVFCEEHVFNINESRDILSTARKKGFKIRMHADEIKPIGGAELAAEIGAVSADHLGAASDKGLQAMKEAGVIPILLPGTIFSLGMKSYARARDMIELGLPVALATDYNPGSCNLANMQMVITLAALEMKMTTAEAITAATINAAHSLEMGNIVGSLEKDKQADLLIMDMPTYKYLPYHFGANNVETVIKRGKIIWQK